MQTANTKNVRQNDGRLWRLTSSAEEDRGFRDILISLNKSGLMVVGWLGIVGALLAVIVPLLFGKQLVGQYDLSKAGDVLVFWDKLLIMLLGMLCLGLSRITLGLGIGRLIVAVLLLAAATATTMDDIARNDIAFSPAYLALIMLISISVQYRPWQTFSFCLAVLAGYIIMVTSFYTGPGWSVGITGPRQLVFLLLATLLCTGINTLLYRSRYLQHLGRKRAEELKERAAESEKKYRSLFDNATDAIFILNNATGCFEMVNPMMENLLGIPATELYSMQFHEIVDPEDVSRIVGYHRARMKGLAAPMQYTFKARCRLWSEPRICDMKLYTYDEDDDVTVGAVRDITERVRAEEQIRKIAAELKDKNLELRETQAQLVQSAQLASLGNLVAGVAHELNTPLGAIQSNTDISSRAIKVIRSELADDDDTEGQKLSRALSTLEELNRVTLSASGRIDTIVTALRNFARLDEAELKEVDIHEGIESAIAILPRDPGKQIHIQKKFSTLPEIQCYPGQINQVFMNLLLNAVEAIDREGTVTITTEHKDNWVVVRFADTGGGIPEEIQSHIFDPGFTTKGVGVGTGLGLSICYRIIEGHGGRAEVKSRIDEGTEVTIHLPVSR